VKYVRPTLDPTDALAEVQAVLHLHQESHQKILALLHSRLTQEVVTQIGVVATATTRMLRQRSAKSHLGALGFALYDYWQHLTYFCGEYPLGPGLKIKRVLPEQISRCAPDDIVPHLLMCYHYPRAANSLQNFLARHFVHPSSYLLHGGYLVTTTKETFRPAPRGHEKLDIYAEVGGHIKRWAKVDPQLTTVDYALNAYEQYDHVSFTELVQSIDRVLGILQRT
jgi:hypothetical protein